VRSARTYRQVSQETGVPLELLGRVLESMGFAPMAPHESIREDELEIVPLLQLGIDLLPLVDPALLAIYHRQEELLWTEGLVERIENELERAGVLGRPEPGLDRRHWTVRRG
jgi:hypothetical protein